MDSSIRPLTLGEILDRTAQLYRTNFLVFAGIFAVYAGLLLIFNLAQVAIMSWADFSHVGVAIRVFALLAIFVKVFVMIAAAGATTAAINRAVAWVHLGQTATIRSAYQSTLPRLGRYVWLSAIIYFVILGPLVLIAGGGVAGVLLVPGLRTGQIETSNQAALLTAGAIFIVVGILTLGWFVYAVLMTLRYSLSVPACVMEDLHARAAIKRSIALTKGSRGRIFILLLLVAAIEVGLNLVSQSFIFVLAFKHHGQIGPLAQSISQIIAFFTNSFLGPIFATGITLFYYDQRIRKEGFDIEWMMLSAGMTPAEAPASLAAESAVFASPEQLSGGDNRHE